MNSQEPFLLRVYGCYPGYTVGQTVSLPIVEKYNVIASTAEVYSRDCRYRSYKNWKE
jgi:hypothetical protein